jgi:hypothetical protein
MLAQKKANVLSYAHKWNNALAERTAFHPTESAAPEWRHTGTCLVGFVVLYATLHDIEN